MIRKLSSNLRHNTAKTFLQEKADYVVYHQILLNVLILK